MDGLPKREKPVVADQELAAHPIAPEADLTKLGQAVMGLGGEVPKGMIAPDSSQDLTPEPEVPENIELGRE